MYSSGTLTHIGWYLVIYLSPDPLYRHPKCNECQYGLQLEKSCLTNLPSCASACNIKGRTPSSHSHAMDHLIFVLVFYTTTVQI